jgi:hypothetical protein
MQIGSGNNNYIAFHSTLTNRLASITPSLVGVVYAFDLFYIDIRLCSIYVRDICPHQHGTLAHRLLLNDAIQSLYTTKHRIIDKSPLLVEEG